MSQLRISEIFHSIQGEGILAGTPSTFIRISGCNLRCIWCDTKYASWHPEGDFFSPGEISQSTKPEIHHVVITGGEPMLFEPVAELTRLLKSQGKHITIETAGTVFQPVECDLMSISPKLTNSSPGSELGESWSERHEQTRWNPEVITKLVQTYDFQLKFVVSNSSDLDEIDAMLAELPLISPEKILLMAEGTSSEVQHERQKSLVPICMDRGWRLSPRLHIDLFGNTKGT